MDSLPGLLKLTKSRLLRMHYESSVGHIGGNLSCLDVLFVIYHQVLGDSDQFVLSKGHSAGALYAVLWSCGRLSDNDLDQFHREDTRLSAHPPASGIAEIPFATGSLGHGFSLAAGLALAKKIKQEPGQVFCLTSDGEWNEGSCWEALIFSLHHRLDNLTVIVDLNGLQGFGSTREVANLEPLADKFRAFGADTIEMDGHRLDDIRQALSGQAGFRIVIAKTRKGNGVSFMQDKMEWHYLPMSQAQFEQALNEVSES